MADGSHIDANDDQHNLALKFQHILGPLETERQFWDEQAIIFAKEITNKIFMLNGGALIAIPSFAAVAQDFSLHQYFFSMVIFAIGMVFGVRANYFGFLSCAERSKYATGTRNSVIGFLNKRHSATKIIHDKNITHKMSGSDSLHHFDAFNKYRQSGFLCSTWALASFMLGIAIAAIQLL